MITKDWHVFKRKDEKPWPTLSDVDKVKSKWEFTAVVMAKHDDGAVYLFNSIKEACKNIGLSYSKVKNIRTRCISNGLSFPPVDGWRFDEYDSVVGIDVKDLQPQIKKKRYKDKEFSVKNILTGESSIILGIKKLSKFIDYSEGRILDCIRNRQFRIGDYEVIQTGLTHARV